MTSRDLIFSYYPYPVSARPQTHSTIFHPVSSIVRDRRLASASSQHDPTNPHDQTTQPKRRKTSARPEKQDAKGHAYSLEQQKIALEAAEWRAVRGLRPAGVDMAKEADELSEEERVMDDERDNLNLFGHRFLLPFGRRQTQAETEALPQSPTPSQDPDERRQEDQDHLNGLASSPPPMGMGMGMGMTELGALEEDGADERDLDASIEDMDADADEEGEVDLHAGMEDMDGDD